VKPGETFKKSFARGSLFKKNEFFLILNLLFSLILKILFKKFFSEKIGSSLFQKS